MYRALIVNGLVMLTLVTPGVRGTAAAQAPGAAPAEAVGGSVTPRVTVRLHAGPNVNLMKDWRDGLSTLRDLAGQRGLVPTGQSCICMSWGSTALVHLTPRLAIGGAFEMLRDTRRFDVEDHLRFIGQSATFGFGNETVVQTKQVVAALYAREGSRGHVQISAGTGSGHTTLSTPGSGASGRVKGTLLSISAGTESRFWYVDAGWRFLRMRSTNTAFNDHALDEARDVFASVAAVEDFARGRDPDFTGGWARGGLVLHLGRRKRPLRLRVAD